MQRVTFPVAGVLTIGLLSLGAPAAHAAIEPDLGPVAGGTSVTIPVPVEHFSSIEAGQFGNLAMNTEGALMGWGGTHFKTRGGLNEIAFPSEVPGLPGGALRDYGLTGPASWAIDSGGKLWVWGRLPIVGGQQATPIPAPTAPDADLMRASVSDTHALAVDADGVVWAWGNNWQGQLGTGATGPVHADAVEATAVNEALRGLGRQAVDVSVGINSSFVTDNAGGLWTFGMNRSGMLGQGNASADNPQPTLLSGIQGKVVATDATNYTGFALTDTGKLYSWGARTTGILGDGGSGDLTFPRAISALGGVNIVDFSVATYLYPHVLAMTDTGELWSWGSNGGGQLGRATSGDSDPLPAIATTPDTIQAVQVSAGAEYSLALLADDTVRAWGVDHNGSLGRGIHEDSAQPVPSGLSTYARVAIGGTSTAVSELLGVPAVTVTTPAHPSGAVDVDVTTVNPVGNALFDPGPAASYPRGFAYQAVLAFEPQNGEAAQRVTVVDGPVVAPANPKKPGSAFQGWFSEPTGGEEGLPAVPMAADATVYAHWEPAAQSGLSATVSDLEFGQVAVGSVRSGTVTVQNDGAQKAWVRAANAQQLDGQGIVLSGEGAAFALEPGASTELEVRWQPRRAGVLDTTADFTIAESAAGLSAAGAQTVSGAIRGDAVAEAAGGGGVSGDTSKGGGGFVAETGWGSPAGIAVAAVLVVLAGGAVLLLRGRKR